MLTNSNRTESNWCKPRHEWSGVMCLLILSCVWSWSKVRGAEKSHRSCEVLWGSSNRQLWLASQAEISSKVGRVPEVKFGLRQWGVYPWSSSCVCEHDLVSLWKAQEIVFSMSKRIVVVIIGDMLFHPDDMDGISKVRAVSVFKLCESSDDDVN